MSSDATPDQTGLSGDYLCTADFEVGGGLLSIGASPWGERRLGYVTGGRFEGPRLKGAILPGGGNWSQAGRLASGEAVGTFDARAVWQTDDGDLIYLTYTGRSVIPDAVRAAFASEDAAVRDVDPAHYFLRVAMVFETASVRYGWLNGVLAIGKGRRTDTGVQHRIFCVD